MYFPRRIITVLLACMASGFAQTPTVTPPAFGSIEVAGGQVKSGKELGLKRKRFYVFEGDLQKNAALIERIKAAKITSRDCYYKQNGASPCFIDWLKTGSCETPFCRKIENDDLLITEFMDAYNKGLPAYGNKPCLALDWVVNNLPEKFAGGYYLQQKKLTDDTLGGVKPIESTMTTEKAGATFSKVPVGDKPAKFVVSNVLPVEFGGKGYVWVCEMTIERTKLTQTANLFTDPNEPKMKKSNCVVFTQTLAVCSTEKCEKKTPEKPVCEKPVPAAPKPSPIGN